MDNKTMKILGIVATAVGVGASLLSGYVGEKKSDAKIEKKVEEALAKQLKNY